ncbi:MAG: hypothetical protein MN733_36825 [Nitrososphaera sp.]|nr:hypothetical protein [Nitrososphaera sp.]
MDPLFEELGLIDQAGRIFVKRGSDLTGGVISYGRLQYWRYEKTIDELKVLTGFRYFLARCALIDRTGAVKKFCDEIGIEDALIDTLDLLRQSRAG